MSTLTGVAPATIGAAAVALVGGAFPAWLAPEPVWILPISEENETYADSIAEQLDELDVNCVVTDSGETLGKRIQQSQSQKIPYTLIVGSDEEESGTVEVREYGEDDSYESGRDEFIEQLQDDLNSKRLIHDSFEFGE
jgi:threonyl-tRNA synthetase